MKKWCILLLMLAMVGLLVAGCGQADPEKDAQTVVAEVGGQKITKGEANKIYPLMEAQMLQMYEQYGTTVDPNAKEFVSSVKATVLGVLTEGVALEQKLAQMGNGLTEEDHVAFETQAQAEYDSTLASYMESGGIDEETARAELATYGYTVDGLAYSNYRAELESRLQPFATENVTVTDEQLKTKYDELVATAETTYETTPTQFITDYNNGATLYTIPDGFRLVKNLVIGYTAEQNALITEKDDEYFSKLIEQFTLGNEISGNTEATEEEKAATQAKIDELTADMERINEETQALREVALEEARPAAEEVLAKVQEEGADFDALMTEYSIDTPPERVLATGYPVTEGTTYYVASFTEGAMALTEIGEVSDLIASEYGFHILKYVGDLTAGPVAFDEVKDAIETQALAEAKDTAFYDTMLAWIEAASIKTYINRY